MAMQRNLTTLDTLKLYVTVEDGKELFYEDLIRQASGLAESFCERTFARSVYVDQLPSDGRTTLMVETTPLVHVVTVERDGTEIPASEFKVLDSEAGFLYRDGGWQEDTPLRFRFNLNRMPFRSRGAFEVEYIGGYLLPDDNIEQVVVADAASSTFSGTNFPLLVKGDQISVSGYTNAGNNGTFRVVDADQSSITVDANLVDETPTEDVTIEVRNLPYDVEKAVIETVRSWSAGSDRDPSLESESITNVWKATYTTADVPDSVSSMLTRYKRAY